MCVVEGFQELVHLRRCARICQWDRLPQVLGLCDGIFKTGLKFSSAALPLFGRRFQDAAIDFIHINVGDRVDIRDLERVNFIMIYKEASLLVALNGFNGIGQSIRRKNLIWVKPVCDSN